MNVSYLKHIKWCKNNQNAERKSDHTKFWDSSSSYLSFKVVLCISTMISKCWLQLALNKLADRKIKIQKYLKDFIITLFFNYFLCQPLLIEPYANSPRHQSKADRFLVCFDWDKHSSSLPLSTSKQKERLNHSWKS